MPAAGNAHAALATAPVPVPIGAMRMSGSRVQTASAALSSSARSSSQELEIMVEALWPSEAIYQTLAHAPGGVESNQHEQFYLIFRAARPVSRPPGRAS